MPDSASSPRQDTCTEGSVTIPEGAKMVMLGGVQSRSIEVVFGDSTFPARSVACTSTTCRPSDNTRKSPPYSVHGPLSIRYRNDATPAQSSSASRCTVTGETYQPSNPGVPRTNTRDTGA